MRDSVIIRACGSECSWLDLYLVFPSDLFRAAHRIQINTSTAGERTRSSRRPLKSSRKTSTGYTQRSFYARGMMDILLRTGGLRGRTCV
jgi:hypothetical protein